MSLWARISASAAKVADWSLRLRRSTSATGSNSEALAPAWKARLSGSSARRQTAPAKSSSTYAWYSNAMRWLVLLATLSLIAQDDEDMLARHAASASEAMQAGDYASAEKHNRAIVRLRPEMAEAEVNLGLSLYLQKKYEEAIHAFEDGLKRKPEMANAWLFLGISRFNLNRPKDALPALRRYTARQPGDMQGQYFLGLTYLVLKRYADAEKPLLAARAIDPRNIDVLYHLAQCYLGQARQAPDRHDSFWPPFEKIVYQIAAIDSRSFRISQLRAG